MPKVTLKLGPQAPSSARPHPSSGRSALLSTIRSAPGLLAGRLRPRSEPMRPDRALTSQLQELYALFLQPGKPFPSLLP